MTRVDALVRPPAGETRDVSVPSYVREPKSRAAEAAEQRRARARIAGRTAVFNPGWIVVIATVLLALLGVHAIGLASGLRADGTGGGGFELGPLGTRQAVFVVLGLIGAAVCAVPDYRRFVRFVPWAAVGTLGLLVFLLVPFVPEAIVTPRNGARRWINLGFIDFQPSELAKVVYVLAMAAWLRYRVDQRTLLGLAMPALITFVPMGLILVEPDLGTAMLFMPALVVMLIAAGAKLKHLILTGALGGVFAAVVVGLSLLMAQVDSYPLLRPHQVERIQAVVDSYKGDERFVDSRGFQGRQAKMLIGAGGATGHDDERARAFIHFSSLPERHNDMIYAVIVNRYGVVGAIALAGVYLLWFVGALLTAAGSKDPFGRLIIVGFVGLLATQAFINMGMTLGLLPITGMTLPFVSYGGSSLLMGFVMVGIILNVGLRRPEKLWRDSFEFGR